jgi:two-component system NarL family response regulator
MPFGVIVIHPEEVMQRGWQLLLARRRWLSGCWLAGDEQTAIALATEYDPAVAVVDLEIGRDRAAGVIAALHAHRPEMRGLLVCAPGAIGARAAYELGFHGVVLRSLPADELADAVRSVATGRRLFAVPAPKAAGSLSAREREVLTHMATGLTNREIAAVLSVSNETVKQHAASVYRKLGVPNRTAAAERGHQLGLLQAADSTVTTQAADSGST